MVDLTQLWVGLAAGLAAAPHCAGMCGAFPLHLARAGEGRSFGRQAAYLLGKLFTYAFLGALAGAGGRLLVGSRWLALPRDAFSYAAGALLIVFGLNMLGWLPRLPWTALVRGARSDAEAPTTPFFLFPSASFLQTPRPAAAFLLGTAAGFLPCPVTLAVMLAAATTGSAARAMLALTGVGLGTAPVLLGIGLSGSLIDVRRRRLGLRGAGAIILLLGLTTFLRPTGLLCRLLALARIGG